VEVVVPADLVLDVLGLESPFDSVLVPAFVSDLVSGFVSDFVSVLDSPLDPPLLEPLSALLGRLSVMYQPDPLNTIPAGNNTFRTDPPHSGHSATGASLNF
jgi:hypothetical protein